MMQAKAQQARKHSCLKNWINTNHHFMSDMTPQVSSGWYWVDVMYDL